MLHRALPNFDFMHISLAMKTVAWEQFLYFLDESKPNIHATEIIVVPPNFHM